MHASVRPPATWEQVAHASNRYVLPLVAGTALTVGVGIAVASQAAPPIVAPIALIVAGAAGVLSWVVYARRRPTIRLGRELAAPSSRRVTYDHSLASAPLYYGEPRPVPVRYPAVDPTPRESARTVGEFPSHLRAGDQLWTQWTTSGVGELPVASVGPFSDVPFLPSEPEKFDPFSTLTEEIQALPVPPAETPVVRPPRDAAVDLASRVPMAAIPLCRSPGSDLDPTMLEALSMYPPHLRSSLTPVFPGPPSTAPRDPSSLCVSCRVVPYEGTVWLPCPDCSGPVCGACVLASFDRDEPGWCSGCAKGRSLENRAAAS